MRNIIEKQIFRIVPNDIRVKFARNWGVRVGKNTRLFSNKFGSEPYLISIGNHCEIANGVTFVTHDGGTWIFRENRKYLGARFGTIIIHDNCFIGLNSIILPNVEIGPNSVIGAGSVVTKDIPGHCIYAGNPAHFICTTDDYLNKCKTDTDNAGLKDYRSEGQKEEIIKHFSHKFKNKL